MAIEISLHKISSKSDKYLKNRFSVELFYIYMFKVYVNNIIHMLNIQSNLTNCTNSMYHTRLHKLIMYLECHTPTEYMLAYNNFI